MFLSLGMGIGLVFGALPGLGGATALALLMPLTYGLEPFTAVALAGGVMGAVPMGGSLTAILLTRRARRPMPRPASTAIRSPSRARPATPSAPPRPPIRSAASSARCRCSRCCRWQSSWCCCSGRRNSSCSSILALRHRRREPRAARCCAASSPAGIGLMIATVGYDGVTGTTRFAWRHRISVGRRASRAGADRPVRRRRDDQPLGHRRHRVEGHARGEDHQHDGAACSATFQPSGARCCAARSSAPWWAPFPARAARSRRSCPTA